MKFLIRYLFKRDFAKRALLNLEILKWFRDRNIIFMAKFFRRYIYYKYNIDVSIESILGSNLTIPHPIAIIIGPNAIIGNNVTISQGVTIGGNYNKSNKQIIGNNTFLSTGCKILGDLVIGNDCIVGANSVVTKSIPSGSVVVGYNQIISKKSSSYLK